MQSTPAACARFATPSAVLPNAVWASIRPSPVMTSLARSSLASKSVASISSSTPGRSANERNRSWIGEQREADPAGGARTRRVALAPALARLELVGPRRVARVEQLDVLGRRALLRAVGRGRALRAEQRVVDVAGDLDVDLVEAAGRVASQPLEQAPAAVGRGAAADAEDDVARRRHRSPRPSARRCRSTSRRSASRSCAATPRQPGRLGHLDHGPRARRPSAASARSIGRPIGSVTVAVLPGPAAGRLDRRERALAAVGQRAEQDLVLRPGACASRPRARARPAPTSASP